MYLVVIILIYSAFIGLVMEIYKKVIKKDSAKSIEIRIVAFILSVLFSFFTYKILPIEFVFEELENTPFLMIFYTISIYLLQLPSSMKIWKPMIKNIIEREIK